VHPTAEQVINVVDAHRLQEATYSKKDFITWAKGYAKTVFEKLTAAGNPRADQFKKQITPVIQKIVANWEKEGYGFYHGESYNPDATLIIKFYKKEDEHNPFLWYFKDGLEAEKV